MSFSTGSLPIHFGARLVKQGFFSFALLLALLSCGAPAQAQPDTTRPTVTVASSSSDEEGARLSHLPTPLTGQVFDAGGMGALLTVRLYRARNGGYERWSDGGWVDIAAVDSHWTGTVTPTSANNTYNWSVEVPWPTGADLPPDTYTIGVSAIDNAGNRTNVHRTFIVEEPDTTPPTVAVDGSSSDQEGALLASLPTPLSGLVFDAGGISEPLTVRLYRYSNPK